MQRLPRVFGYTFVVAAALSVVMASVAGAGDTKSNKELMTEFFNTVVNQGKVDMVDTYLASDFVEHETMPPGIAEGREGCKQFFTMYLKAFPDAKVTIDDMIAEGDQVVARETWTGTNKGEFMGMPATGKKVSYTVIDIVQFKDGKGVAHWGAYDSNAMMMQLHPEMKMGMMGKGMEKMKEPTQSTN